MSKTSQLFLALLLCSFGQPLAAGLASGPMLASLEMREAKIWVQTDEPSIVRVNYAETGNTQTRQWSLPVETDPKFTNTATVVLPGIEPGKRYTYRIELNGDLETTAHQFRSPDFYHGRTPPPDFSFAVGGAHYKTEEGFEPPYQILGAGYGIFETIASANPEFMLWLGNTAHLRSSDWTTQSGYLKRYSAARGTAELRPLLAGIPHYATWGEADYGAPGTGALSSYRGYAETAFRAFWPRPVEIAELPGIATRFRYADVDFFLLDTRSHRNETPSSDQPFEILGKAQIEWLRQEVLRSEATFKIIAAGAPILNPAKSPGNLSFAETEQTNLLQTLRSEEIDGLFFLSGGKYYGELTRLVHANSYNLFDLTVGPLTANPRDNREELNFFRMPGTSTFERHFAMLDVTGPEDDRSITIRILSAEGNELWKREIRASELKFAD